MDSVHLLITGHSFPCKVLYAHSCTKRIDDNNSIFKVALEYTLIDGVAPELFEVPSQEMDDAIANMLKEIIAN